MENNPRVYWLTGLSDSGKSTLCDKLVGHLRSKGRCVVKLDGDEIRAVVGAVSSHTRDDRMALAMRYSRLCKLLADQGFDVAIATISLFSEVHSWNRKNLPGYREIFLDVPLSELRKRDTKGIYSRAERNEIKDVAGLDLTVDFPENPHVRLLFDPQMGVEDTFRELIRQLAELDSV